MFTSFRSREYELTFQIIHDRIVSQLNWCIGNYIEYEDINYYMRVVSFIKELIGITGQHRYSEAFNKLNKRLLAIESKYFKNCKSCKNKQEFRPKYPCAYGTEIGHIQCSLLT